MSISVAKAVFTSTLLRRDFDSAAPDISRDDAVIFTRALSRASNICTKAEVKACKDFITRNIIPSATRTTALSKYLVAFSKSCTSPIADDLEGLEDSGTRKSRDPPTAAFRRLHLTYVLHDVLCFMFTRLKDGPHAKQSTSSPACTEALKSAIQSLAHLAAHSEGNGPSTTLASVQRIVDYWERLSIFTSEQCSDLQSSITVSRTWDDLDRHLASQEAKAILDEQRRKGEESKWILPRQHHLPHDPTTPWHDLPATNALYQKRMRGFPIHANALKPGGMYLQRGGQQASEALRRDVEQLHREALRCFDKYTDAEEVKDVDALGSVVWKDRERPTRNYYGFTYEGIAKRKEADRQPAWYLSMS
ncbi:hypothetical protein B0A48_02613 [Cryoendolithus antarcticus]|uniref:CID domain-containing protein n=1 Tax=Cryoendolithus antarcticus TaxID=1507870 RepID=A0A1V8TP47_9PEZI|nr:hypothetical protein B0A48_02613 [Cryoendolithus antarcticus]